MGIADQTKTPVGLLTEEATESPSAMLARQIIARLIEAQLISADNARKLEPKLADGTLKGDDWRLALELSIEKAGQR